MLRQEHMKYHGLNIKSDLGIFNTLMELFKHATGQVMSASTPFLTSFSIGLIHKTRSKKPLMLAIDKKLIITPDFPPFSGGISSFLGKLSENFSSESVIVLAPSVDGDKEYDQKMPFTIYRELERRPLKLIEKKVAAVLSPYTLMTFKLLKFIPNTLNIIKREKINVIICGHVVAGMMSFFIKVFKGINYIIIAYGTEIVAPLNSSNRVTRMLYNLVLSNASAVVAISSFTKHQVRKWGIPDENIKVLHPGVDQNFFKPNPDTSILKEKYNLGDNKIILTVARLVKRKGHDLVIRNLPKILKKITKVLYLIVGNGPMKPYLHQLAVNYGVEDNVIFTGFVDDKDLPKYYNASDVFIMLPKFDKSVGDVEGFGIVYLEANACGKPVIASKSGGIEDAVIDGVTGLLVDSLNEVQIIETIVKVLSDSNYAKKLGQQGRERIEKELNWQVVTKRMQGIIDDIVRVG